MPRISLPVLQAMTEFTPPPTIPDDYPVERITVAVARHIAGSLGHTSKMPGYSYGLSAELCQTGSKLRKKPGSVCSACYAMTDWYRTWRPLLEGHRRRWRGIHHKLWVPAMIKLISSACKPPNNYFRWHDSGDIQGLWHLENIATVCRATPDVHYWMPTREYELVRVFLLTHQIPDNLVIRLSAHMIDSEPVLPEALAHLPTSTVSTVSRHLTGVALVEGKGSVECRAVEVRDNKCGDCRACWESRVKCVNYPQH